MFSINSTHARTGSYLSRLAILIVLLCPVFTDRIFADDTSLRPIEIETSVDGIIVRTTLENAFSPDLLEALKTGIPVEFYFQIQLMRSRWYWFNSKLDKIKVLHSVSYDTLNKQYKFSRKNGDSTTRITESLDECKQWMADLHVLLPLKNAHDYGKSNYYIKVTAESQCSAPGTFGKKRQSSRKFAFQEE